MTLVHPSSGLAAAGLIAFFGFFVFCARHRATARALRYSNLEFLASAVRPRKWIPATLDALWLLSLGGVALAATGPHLRVAAPLRDAAVVVCIDTSGSMASTDVSPTRALAARRAARAFITGIPSGVKVGIVAFSQTARVVAPVSEDRAAITAALDNLPGPNGATAIGDALEAAAAQLTASGHRFVVLITDGVSNAGSDPNVVAQTLATDHVAIFAIGLGTENGDPIARTDERATIDETALRAYARETGGSYTRADTAAQLYGALREFDRSVPIGRRSADCSLAFAIGGACGMALAFLIGCALGEYP
ncbi:MAG: VWA domain-containing protein [Candidatus Eremiobacteraeota bacterium]|nr:VWA domain-containing protein [Candidatus Eremiobacteraeota bacterium]